MEPHIIRQIKDTDGNVLYQRETFDAPVIIRARELGMMNAMLSGVIRQGTGRSAALPGRPAAGKTGTSQRSRDGLFIGYTADLVTGIWFGNDDGSPTRKVTGGSLPAGAWKSFMAAAHKGLPVTELPGYYEPVVASVPAGTPTRRLGPGQLPVRDHTSIGGIVRETGTDEAGRRKRLSEIGVSTPEPSIEVQPSDAQQRPRTILDLIFGD